MRVLFSMGLMLWGSWISAASPKMCSGALAPDQVKNYVPVQLPAPLSRSVRNLLEMKPADSGLLDPIHKTLYFNWRKTGSTQVWKLSRPGETPVQVTAGPLETRVLEVSPQGDFIVISRDADGEENPGLYLLNTKDGKLRQVQHQPKVQTKFMFISADGRQLFYAANDRHPEFYTLYSYDIKTGQTRLLFDEPGTWTFTDQNADGQFLLKKIKGGSATEYYLFDPARQLKTPLLGYDEAEDYELYFSHQSGEYLVLTNKMSDFKKLYRWSLKAGFREIPVFTPGEPLWDIEVIQPDAKNERLYFAINRGGRYHWQVLAMDTLRPLPFPEFAGADQMELNHISHDGRYVSLSVSGAQDPRATFIFDWQTHKLERWEQIKLDSRRFESFAAVELSHYLARDGVEIPMLIRRPKFCATIPCPVLVKFHGGPESQAKPGFNPNVQIFVDAGFIVVEPNVRGSLGYGKTWAHADDGVKRLDVITDIEDCATFIRRNWTRAGEAPKIGVMGYSYGGYSTLMAMSRFAGAYDAGVAIVGMSNLLTFLKNTAPYRRHLRLVEYGNPETEAEVLKALSPATYVDQIKAPLLIIHGLKDPRVPASEAVQMHELLQSRGATSQLIIFPDEGHGAKKLDNQVLELGHTLLFFQQHLLPQEN